MSANTAPRHGDMQLDSSAVHVAAPRLLRGAAGCYSCCSFFPRVTSSPPSAPCPVMAKVRLSRVWKCGL